jgi:hypothetical protein
MRTAHNSSQRGTPLPPLHLLKIALRFCLATNSSITKLPFDGKRTLHLGDPYFGAFVLRERLGLQFD